jgi:hypothetical protein
MGPKFKGQFPEIGFTTNNYFTVFRHSATNSGLLCKNRFRFQGESYATVCVQSLCTICRLSLRREETQSIVAAAVNGLILP